MSVLQPKDRIEVIFCSDLHLTLNPPIARSLEKDWLKVQGKYLNELHNLSIQANGPVSFQIPIVCCGDVFDKWNPSVELVNWTISHLPKMYAVPGNHELPNHSYAELKRSAFFTLVQAGKIELLPPDTPIVVNAGLCLHGHPYGFPVKPYEGPSSGIMWDIAITHEYVWTDKTGYPGAPESGMLSNLRSRSKGYDLVACGDNHKGFLASKQSPIILNCGGFIRRNIDQIDYQPRVWGLTSAREIKPFYLNTEDDVFLTPKKVSDTKVCQSNIGEFVETLKDIQGEFVSFEDAVIKTMKKNNVSDEVQRIILTSLEK